MEISNFKYSELAELAQIVVDKLVTETDTGYSLIDQANVKPMTKMMLWVASHTDEEIQPILDEHEDFTTGDLYYFLEDEGAFEISKKDLPKYKWYTDMVFALIKGRQELNEAVVASKIIKMNENLSSTVDVLSALTGAFGQISSAISELNEEALKARAKSLTESIQSMMS